MIGFSREIEVILYLFTGYLEFKERKNENDMGAHAFWAVFSSSQQRSQISPHDIAAIPPPTFFFRYCVPRV